MPAESISDNGVCVVKESRSGFCTLDWRHGAGDSAPDPTVETGAEIGALAFRQFALGRNLPRKNLFKKEDVWNELEAYTREVLPDLKLIYRGAASYLNETSPERYKPELVLTSIAILIGSTIDPNDRNTPTLVFNHISRNADAIIGRLSGASAPAQSEYETTAGLMVDMSSRGCFEVRRFPQGKARGFDFRIVVKTSYSESGRGCGPR